MVIIPPTWCYACAAQERAVRHKGGENGHHNGSSQCDSEFATDRLSTGVQVPYFFGILISADGLIQENEENITMYYYSI